MKFLTAPQTLRIIPNPEIVPQCKGSPRLSSSSCLVALLNFTVLQGCNQPAHLLHASAIHGKAVHVQQVP